MAWHGGQLQFLSKGLTDDNGNLELLDTVADGDELAGTPHETLHLDRTHRLLELRHVSLVVPRLDLEGNKRLKIMRYNWGKYDEIYLGSGLRLEGLLCVVSGDALSLDTLRLLVDLIIRTKEVDLVIILLGGGSSCGRRSGFGEGLASRARAGERAKLGLVRLDVRVPASRIGGGFGVRDTGERLEDVYVRLRWRVP